MGDEEFIELEDAEIETRAVVKRRTGGRIENLIIDSSVLTQRESLRVWEMRGYFDLVISPGGILRRKKTITYDFKVVLDASSGNCVGARL